MPQERENQYPNVTADQWAAIRKDGTPREVLAARLVAARKIEGIPHRPYLLGTSDSAPVLRGVAEFCGKVYALLDHLNQEVELEPGTHAALGRVQAAMEEFKL